MKQPVAAALAAVALSLCAFDASAMYLNSNGLGQVLVYPYYTVNGGYATFFTITNSTAAGKAVKVRLLEGYNGRDVQDFNLYLSAFDYWVGAVIDSGNGGAAIFTNDASCTVPQLPTSAATALPLTTANFDGTSAQGKDGGPADASRTREGHIEVIEMGALTGPTATLQAITHQANGVPADCPAIVAAWAGGGRWTIDPTRDVGPPSGGLSGNSTILNAANGTVFSYSADAVAQFYAKGGSGEHSRPDALTPNIAGATSPTAEIHSDDGSLGLTYARPVDAVSALFMGAAVQNEYWTSKSIAAASEWVVTYPTKRFYVDPYFTAAPQPPFDSLFTSANGGTAFSIVKAAVFDREEQSPISFAGTRPSSPKFGLSYEAQVVTFNQEQSYSRIVESHLVSADIPTANFDNGWAMLALSSPSHSLVATNGNTLVGQPVTGFWITQLVNGNVGGALANYTASFRHKLQVSCTRADGAPCL